MNALEIQKVGLWTALAGAIAALVVLVSTKKPTMTVHTVDTKYDDIFGV
jgi:hypothetical protein